MSDSGEGLEPGLRAAHALWVRVDVEPIAAHETNQCDAAPLGKLDREARWCRDGCDEWNAWSSFSAYIPWHTENGYLEGGKSGHGSHAVKFQMRPHPLAK